MKPFILALGLRVVGSRVKQSNAQPQQPPPEAGVMTDEASAPRWPVVAGDSFRKSVAAEDLNESCLCNGGGICTTSLQTDNKTGVVVKYSKWITAAMRQLKLAFEIHL